MKLIRERCVRFVLLLMLVQAAGFEQAGFAQDSAGTSPAEEAASEDGGKAGSTESRHPLEPVAIPLKDGFGEGWKQAVRVKPGDELCDVYELWVEGGWLYVRRTDEHGDLDWQLKLAELQQVGSPTISMIGEGFAFHVSSEDGRFFIRETLDVFRSMRQRSEGDGAILGTDLLPEDSKSTGYASVQPNQALTLSAWRNEPWFYAASGPDKDHFNFVVRLNPLSMSDRGSGFRAAAGDLTHLFHGNTHVWDDGELLLAYRTLRTSYERELVRTNLPGSVPPEIEAAQWLNTEELTWKDLEGKVVLLDFWATWCSPCIAKLPDVQELANKYADQGLVVIGIHSDVGADKCPDYVREKEFTFPIALDTGTTAERYAVGSLPSYFLISKTGKVVDGYASQPPSEETIRNLLTEEEE